MDIKKEDILDILKSMLIGFIIAFIITCFVKQVKVVGSSMENTFEDGQRLLIARQAYFGKKTPQKDDIVVVNTDKFGESKKIIKRVIAVEGQSLEIKGSDVYIDGEKIDEPYIKEEMIPTGDIYIEEIPEGKLFIMGDNRNNSGDSRQIGLVDEDDIYGKVIGY
jgi:signal peptidase I